MKKLITFSLLTIPLLLNAEVTLDSIEVNAEEEGRYKQLGFLPSLHVTYTF